MSESSWDNPIPLARRPILHVNIKQDGVLLTDVDAHSTIGGMAYYLWSRHLEEGSEEEIMQRIADALPGQPDGATVIRESRSPVGGALISSLMAEIGP